LCILFFFKATRSQANLTEARSLTLLSYSAYCGANVSAAWNCYWCRNVSFEWHSNFGEPSGSMFGFGGIFQNYVTVVFRGTDNIAGFITDGDFLQTAYPGVNGALVHAGFLAIYQTYNSVVLALVADLISACPSCQIMITGHSLGAALATLAAAEITQKFASKAVVLYNFGSPRVGNHVFSSYLNATLSVGCYRFTNQRDLVPMIPYQFLNYHHIREEVWYNGNSFVNCDDSGEDPHCEDSQHLPSIFDHATYFGIDIFEGIPDGCLFVDSSSAIQLDKIRM